MIGQDAYYGRPEVSNSDLSALENYFMPKDYVMDATAAYRFGNLIDAMVTESHRCDHYNRRVDGEQFTAEEWAQATQMLNAFRKDAECMNLLKMSTGQNVMIRRGQQFEYQGIPFELDVRCKWDGFMPHMKWGWDLKSTTATTQKQFEEACRHFKYTRQRAWYMDIAGSDRDMLIGISKKNFQVFKIRIRRDDDFYLTGKAQYSEWAFRYWTLFGNLKQAA